MPNTFNLRGVQAHFKRVLLYAPGLLGNEALNFFNDSFRRQGWLGNRLEPWQRRKNDGRRKGRAILIDSARLRRGNRIVSNSGGIVTLGNNTPYARVHNEGYRGSVNVRAYTRNKYTGSKVGSGKFTKKGKERLKTVYTVSGSIQVKAHTKRLNIPQRKFMGNSPYLLMKLRRLLQAELNKGLR